MARTIIAVYSRSGVSARVAQTLGEIFPDAMTVPIQLQDWPKPSVLRCLYWAITRREPILMQVAVEPQPGDRVIVVGPVWMNRIATPLQAWMRRHGGQLTRWALVLTREGTTPVSELSIATGLAARPPERVQILSKAETATDVLATGEPLAPLIDEWLDMDLANAAQ